MNALVQLRRPTDPRSPSPDLGAARSRGLVYMETYGCQMNVADTDLALGLLRKAGYERTDDPARADVILINTCAVREKAEERVYARASALVQHKRGPRRVILGITGCMAEHLRDGIFARAPFVDMVVGPDGYRRLLDHIESAGRGQVVLDTALDRHETYEGLDGSPAPPGSPIGRITIQRGCDKFCSFCVVPLTRGRERGTPPREILRRARALVAAGVKEIQLLGQTVNSYRYEDVGFADLLRAVAAVEGVERVRFTSPYPLDFSPDVIAAIAESPKVCKHVHLPLQTASDGVLWRMRRGYDYARYRALLADLRAAVTDIAITTDLMVGFCDETEDEFAEALRAQEEIRFDNAFTFAYSERSGTHAGRRLPDSVPPEVKRQRLERVIGVQRRITAEILAALVGRRQRVLVEAPSKRDPRSFLARTDNFRPVMVPAGPGVAPGAMLDVLVERAGKATLFGRVVTAISDAP